MPDIRDPLTPEQIDHPECEFECCSLACLFRGCGRKVMAAVEHRREEGFMPRPDAWGAHVHEHGVRARKAYRLPGVTR